MKHTTKNRTGRIAFLAAIPVLFLPMAFSGTYIVNNDPLVQEKTVVPGLNAFITENALSADGFLPDDLTSINAVRRYLISQISYPDEAVNEGHSGTVELFARINNEGSVNEILVLQPVRDFVDVEEIEVTDYAPAGKEITESSRHESLLTESKRVLMSLPNCDVEDLFGKTLKFTFKFVLK
jgi:hypothetical protein